MHLLIFTPCDRVLNDPEQGPSIISAFHGQKIQVASQQELPNDAVIPREWMIFSRYRLLPSEENLVYTAKTQVFWPDGAIFFEMELKAPNPASDSVSFNFRLQGFPVGRDGEFKISQTLFAESEQVYGPTVIPLDVIISRVPFPPRGK